MKTPGIDDNLLTDVQILDTMTPKIREAWGKDAKFGPALRNKRGEGIMLIEQTNGPKYSQRFYLASLRASLQGKYRCCQHEPSLKTREEAEEKLYAHFMKQTPTRYANRSSPQCLIPG
jgi:hypothetical protein